MTSISSGNAALTILQQTQPSLLPRIQGQSATDTILDIVSNRSAVGAKAAAAVANAAAKAQPEAAQNPREVGGTVSSEFSSVQWSAMNAAAVSQLNSTNADDPLIAFKPIEASLENAEIFVGRLAYTLAKYSAQFDLKEIPSREDHMAGKDADMAKLVASGASQKMIDDTLRLNYGEGGYERIVRFKTTENMWTMSQAKTFGGSIGSFTMLLGQVFSQDVTISKDQDGRLTLGALDMSYANGQKMLSYGEDGSLTTFNEDGSTIRTLAAKDLSRL
ncbi:hypothetical protein [Pararhizobium sp. PWRC1-1]|uniref:hypothetical protein n=1 Tax=Pararhizobium sp. PWRC1-1 TaxID=2804566 RepID=UPI003CED9B24